MVKQGKEKQKKCTICKKNTSRVEIIKEKEKCCSDLMLEKRSA